MRLAVRRSYEQSKRPGSDVRGNPVPVFGDGFTPGRERNAGTASQRREPGSRSISTTRL